MHHIEIPYVYVDSTYLDVRNSVTQPASVATVVATRDAPEVAAFGCRRVPSIRHPSATDWHGFCGHSNMLSDRS